MRRAELFTRAACSTVAAVVAVAVPCSAAARAEARPFAGETGARLDTPRMAGAETGAGLSAPDFGRVRPGAEGEWRGPRVELGYARYRISDGYGGGGVHAFELGGYLPTGSARLGMYGELAGRDYAPGASTDLIVRGAVLAGYQQWRGLGPVVPYLVAVGTGGVLFGTRYHTPVSYTMWGAGLELGADVALVRPLWLGVSFSWIRLTMSNLRWDLLLLRVRIGL